MKKLRPGTGRREMSHSSNPALLTLNPAPERERERALALGGPRPGPLQRGSNMGYEPAPPRQGRPQRLQGVSTTCTGPWAQPAEGPCRGSGAASCANVLVRASLPLGPRTGRPGSLGSGTEGPSLPSSVTKPQRQRGTGRGALQRDSMPVTHL